jgi:ferredoxin
MVVSATTMLLVIFLICVISCDGFRSSVFNRYRYSSSQAIQAKTLYKVTLQKNGKKVADLSVPDNKTILDAAIDAGVDVPYDCKLGVCLTCPAKVISGKSVQDVDPASTLDETVIAQGFALNCCLYARSDLVIELIEEDELINAQFVKGAKTTY